MRKLWFLAIILVIAAASGAAIAQSAGAPPMPGSRLLTLGEEDIWRQIPPDSIVVAAFDGRPTNPSKMVISASLDPTIKAMMVKQRESMKKSIEDLATLFGLSLDFAKDIESWSGNQWAFALFPDDKKGVNGALLLSSKDAAAANAGLDKLLEPWKRVATIEPQPDQDYPITAIKAGGFEAYLSAAGPVVAVSISKDALKHALKGGGFAPGSPGDKVFAALPGSMFYAYVDPAVLSVMGAKKDMVPLIGAGLGASVIDTGAKLRIVGFPTEQGAAMLKTFLPAQPAASLTVNAGIPSTTLVAATLPSLASVANMFGGGDDSNAPIWVSGLKLISDMQISGALTAVLPKPAWVISGMADSEATAAAKLAAIKLGLQQMKAPPSSGAITEIHLKGAPAMYLTQAGSYILVGSDTMALQASAASIAGKQPALADTPAYKETMAGLQDSNIMTMYGNLAPIQGLGYLADGLGFGQLSPIYDSFVKSVEGVQSVGMGAGFDGQMASITLFLRAKPGAATMIGPAAVGATAVGAAVLFPMFSRARETARSSTCMADLKQLTMAATMYAEDHDGKLPTAANWRTEIKSYLGGPVSEFKCPSGDSIYAFNKNLSGVSRSSIAHPANTVLFFEADSDLPNAAGSRNDAIFPHNGTGGFAFADGHAQKLEEAPPQSQWVVAQPAHKPVKNAPVKAKRRVH